MEVSLLFRKKSAFTDDGLPWLAGSERSAHWCAARNTTGEAGVSAILIRALLAALEHRAILEVRFGKLDGRFACFVTSVSKSTSAPTLSALVAGDACSGTSWRAYLPNGGPEKVTYYLGLLVLAAALAAKDDYPDLLDQYEHLVQLAKGGVKEPLKTELCRASDELYYALRYEGGPVDPVNDRLGGLEVIDSASSRSPLTAAYATAMPAPYPMEAFYQADALDTYRRGTAAPVVKPTPAAKRVKKVVPAPHPAPAEPTAAGLGSFVGPQAALMYAGLQRRKTVLLAGPTGTGKTLAVEEVVRRMADVRLFRLEGKEGMLDVDFLGNIVPRAQERVWQNGPLAEAIQEAQFDPVIVFLDEMTRFPREQINLLIGFLNRKSGDLCRQEGLNVAGDGPFYVARVPQDNSRVFVCPCDHLLIVAAANFGKDYAVYPLDPALRRRFTMVIEFDYPAAEAEIGLLARAAGLERQRAEALVAVAIESRRVHENGDMPGQIDTASLIEWGRKCVEFSAHTGPQVMDMARLTWGDLVCGRTADGRLDRGHFDALSDHLIALGKLPKA